MTQNKRVLAVVLAGGFGTRLSPLTDSKPKPLVKILDTPVLCHVLDKVQKINPVKTVVSTYYKADMIEKMCHSRKEKIVCKREKTPLGTAGGVKYCADDDFDACLVVSGDGVFDFDIAPALRFHFDNDNDVTIVTARHENPTDFGSVICDETGTVIEFCEKPSWKRVKTSLVNTGIYILSSYAINRIPDRCKYDFSTQLFLKLLEEGRKIKSITLDGAWYDVGTLDEFYTCNMNAAKGKLSSIINDGVKTESLVRVGVSVPSFAYVPEDVSLGKNINIDESVVGEGSVFCDDADVSKSVVGSHCFVGKGSGVFGAILGDDVTVGENCIVSEGSCIGDGVRIADGCVVDKNTHLAPYTSFGRKDMKMTDFSRFRYLFYDDGLSVFDKDEGFDTFAVFAKAIVIAFKKSEDRNVSVCIGCSKESFSVKNALVSGFSGENVFCYDCKDSDKNLVLFSSKITMCDVGVYADVKDDKVNIFICRDGKPVCDLEERKIMKVFSEIINEKNELCKENTAFQIVEFPSKTLYETRLSSFVSKCLGGKLKIDEKLCFDKDMLTQYESLSCLCRVLCAFGISTSSRPCKDCHEVFIDEEERLFIKTKNKILDKEHLVGIAMKNCDLLSCEKTMFSENVPFMLRKRYGNHVPTDGICNMSDDGFLMAAVLCISSLTGENVEKLAMELAPFVLYRDVYALESNRGDVMEKLSKLYNSSADKNIDGIHLTLAEGEVSVVPGRIAGLKIVAEAANYEMAKELCFKIGDAIKN